MVQNPIITAFTACNCTQGWDLKSPAAHGGYPCSTGASTQFVMLLGW
jgi:hypothetical protein